MALNDLLGGFGSGFGMGQGIVDKSRQMRDQSHLSALSSKAYATPKDQQTSLLSEMASISPQAAQQQQTQFQGQEDRQQSQVGNAAKYLLSAFQRGDDAAKQGAYQQVRSVFQDMAPDRQLPDTVDDSILPMLHQVLAQSAGAGGGTNVQSTYVDDEGQRVAIMRDGTTQVLGGNDMGATNQTITIDGPDGRPAQYTFDKRTGGYIPAQEGIAQPQTSYGAPQQGYGQPQQPQGSPQQAGGGQQHFAALTGLAGEFPGTQMTSGMRSAQRNEEVGGAANSQHLAGTAADYVVPDHLKPAFISRARQMGYQSIDEGDHIHLQLPRGGGGGGRSPFVGRSPEENTTATEQAKLDVQFGGYDRMTALEADRAGVTETAKVTAREETERKQAAISSIPKLEASARQFTSIIDKIANHPGLDTGTGLSSKLDPRNRIPGTDAYNFKVAMDQIAGKTFLTAYEELKGGGVITDFEGNKATQAIARLDTAQSKDEFVEAIGELRDIVASGMDRLRSQASGGGQQQYAGAMQQQASPQPPQGSDIDSLLEMYR